MSFRRQDVLQDEFPFRTSSPSRGETSFGRRDFLREERLPFGRRDFPSGGETSLREEQTSLREEQTSLREEQTSLREEEIPLSLLLY
jgi:hypothetical protein